MPLPTANSVLFVQKATHRAGAQSCLVRLLSQDSIRHWRPVVLCSSSGWLTQECGRRGIEFIIVEFPQSRSVLARLYGNSLFVSAVQRKLVELSLRPNIVNANDHWDAMLGIRLAEVLAARSVLFLRTSRITRRDYFKYWCDRYQLVAGVGPVLQARAQSWSPGKKIELIYDGVEPDEFLPPKPKPTAAPKRLLAIGAERSSKGWADLVEALSLLANRGAPLPVQVDFTGDFPSPAVNDLQLSRVPNVRFEFLGRVDEFRDLVRGYDLVVNPSRSDSFGMAAIETLAAGVPLLSSRTGVVAQVISAEHMLFPPQRPEAMADALERLMQGWNELDFGVADAQTFIRRNFPIERTAATVDRMYRQLVGAP
jgi:glycosyltransferase involved in cell wall biosynthesis